MVQFNYKEQYQKWLNSPHISAETKKELFMMSDDEIKSCFYSFLHFGTAGLRGLLGTGTFRMNIYTVRHATQSLADFILEQKNQAFLRGVAIAYDCRIMSKEFAEEACNVFAANGIKSFIFDELRPTPELSFAVRQLNCIAGINITASHNTKEYNGYKVYWEDGAQISLEQAEAIYNKMNSIDAFEDVKITDKKTADSFKTVLSNEFDNIYLSNVLKQRIKPEMIKKHSDMKIIYTPFHGTGYKLVPETLRLAGFENIIKLEEQSVADGLFPTIISPNPENKESFELAIKKAEETDVDLIIGTDPDADRLGVVVRKSEGGFCVLTGNQTGALLLDYIIKAKKENGNLPANACAIKTIVTSELGARICEKNDVFMMNVLTGFKFIGEKMEEFEKSGEYSFIFGYEESYGCLAGTYARDKDAVVASMLVAEAAAYYKEKNMTLWDALCELYKEYGYHAEKLINIAISGADSSEKMEKLMQELRINKTDHIGNLKIKEILDFSKGIMGLPKSDVLYYKTEDNSVLVVRPSGTEPKVKIYIMCAAETETLANEKADCISNNFYSLLKLS